MDAPAAINWATPASTVLFAGQHLQWTTQGDLHTNWRLLWQDDRYADGIIPEDEVYYRFTKPTPKKI
jgi:hypothetical protein